MQHHSQIKHQLEQEKQKHFRKILDNQLLVKEQEKPERQSSHRNKRYTELYDSSSNPFDPNYNQKHLLRPPLRKPTSKK